MTFFSAPISFHPFNLSPSRTLFRRSNFSLLGMLGLTTVTALIAIQNSWWATVFAIELISLHCFVNGMVANVPSAIRQVMNENCLRMKPASRHSHVDPASPANPIRTPDAQRTSKEQSKLNQLYQRLFLVILLIFVFPLNLILLLLESESGFDRIAGNFFEEDQQSNVRVFGISIAALGIVASFLLVRSAYMYFLKRLFKGALHRQKKYFLNDLSGTAPDPLSDRN